MATKNCSSSAKNSTSAKSSATAKKTLAQKTAQVPLVKQNLVQSKNA